MYLKDIDVNINGVNKLHIKDMCLESGKWVSTGWKKWL